MCVNLKIIYVVGVHTKKSFIGTCCPISGWWINMALNSHGKSANKTSVPQLKSIPFMDAA